jgi:glutamate---cysteine ligase / carboxylate-amine ligase
VREPDGQTASRILEGVRERFEASTDFTIGIEEEYQILDPPTAALVNRYEDMVAAAEEPLRERLAGELIASEIEYRTAAHETFAGAARDLVEGRLQTLALAERLGLALAITGVHPFSPWTEQRIIDTEHYRRVEGELGYLAWINNTWSLHVHCGVRGADRAIAVCTAMRSVLPELLALSANSAVFVGRPTRLHSTRTQIFTRNFPRCGLGDPLADWDEYAEFVALLERTGSIQESTQLWWSVRPHHRFGTVEVRICDGQSEMAEALAVCALMVACVAQFALDADAARPLPAHPMRVLDENLWRAQRDGVTGRLIDLERGVERPTAAAIEALLRWSEPARDALGLAPFLSVAEGMLSANGAVRQLARLEALGDVRAVHAEAIERTRRSAHEALAMVGAVPAT